MPATLGLSSASPQLAIARGPSPSGASSRIAVSAPTELAKQASITSNDRPRIPASFARHRFGFPREDHSYRCRPTDPDPCGRGPRLAAECTAARRPESGRMACTGMPRRRTWGHTHDACSATLIAGAAPAPPEPGLRRGPGDRRRRPARGRRRGRWVRGRRRLPGRCGRRVVRGVDGDTIVVAGRRRRGGRALHRRRHARVGQARHAGAVLRARRQPLQRARWSRARRCGSCSTPSTATSTGACSPTSTSATVRQRRAGAARLRDDAHDPAKRPLRATVRPARARGSGRGRGLWGRC